MFATVVIQDKFPSGQLYKYDSVHVNTYKKIYQVLYLPQGYKHSIDFIKPNKWSYTLSHSHSSVPTILHIFLFKAINLVQGPSFILYI